MAEFAGFLLVAACAAGYLGFALLALSLPRHWRDVTGAVPASPRRCALQRVVGYAALVLAFALVVMRDGAAFGSVLAILLLTAVATAVALTLSWRPKLLAAVARAFR